MSAHRGLDCNRALAVLAERPEACSRGTMLARGLCLRCSIDWSARAQARISNARSAAGKRDRLRLLLFPRRPMVPPVRRHAFLQCYVERGTDRRAAGEFQPPHRPVCRSDWLREIKRLS
jgi:hypothetical protein